MGHRQHKWDEHDAFCKWCLRYVCHSRNYRRDAKRQSAKGNRREGKRQARARD